MKAIIPYDTQDPKSRLSPLLTLAERKDFAKAMLLDVVEVLQSANHDPHVILSKKEKVDVPAKISVNQSPLDVIVNVHINEFTPLLVLMADLPLIGIEQLEKLISLPGDVVFAPGLRGGTNGIVIRDDAFTVNYHGTSFRDHQRFAAQEGITTETLDSFRFAIDIDTPEDLIEVMIHSNGHAKKWLQSNNFKIETQNPQPSIIRR